MEEGVAFAVKGGAVFAGSNVTGFWAVWQEEASKASVAKPATRIGSFVTRILPIRYGLQPYVKAR